jgi:hypothetical protein
MTKILFPYKLKKFGWFLVLVPMIVYVILKQTDYYSQSELKLILLRIVAPLFLTGLLLVNFTALKREDEFINHCRLNSFALTFFIIIYQGIIKMFTSGIEATQKSLLALYSTILIVPIIFLYLQIWLGSRNGK